MASRLPATSVHMTKAIKPFLSTNRIESKRRVLNLYRAWIRFCDRMPYVYDIPRDVGVRLSLLLLLFLWLCRFCRSYPLIDKSVHVVLVLSLLLLKYFFICECSCHLCNNLSISSPPPPPGDPGEKDTKTKERGLSPK